MIQLKSDQWIAEKKKDVIKRIRGFICMWIALSAVVGIAGIWRFGLQEGLTLMLDFILATSIFTIIPIICEIIAYRQINESNVQVIEDVIIDEDWKYRGRHDRREYLQLGLSGTIYKSIVPFSSYGDGPREVYVVYGDNRRTCRDIFRKDTVELDETLKAKIVERNTMPENNEAFACSVYKLYSTREYHPEKFSTTYWWPYHPLVSNCPVCNREKPLLKKEVATQCKWCGRNYTLVVRDVMHKKEWYSGKLGKTSLIPE